MTSAEERRGQLEAAAEKLLSRLREHDSLKPDVERKSRHEIGRAAILDLLTQIGRELRHLREAAKGS